ncbi:hypothetical protein CSN02_21460 [Salmonella enterica subsp. enterica serovar Infantis]|nr:bile acid:sodium symporter family protein [Salmonella enterica]ECH1469001.1 bile acid:sodium symporter family protein [Salmonella enterica subsp. enterica serovar Infantis]EBL7127226.1 bile acid:sodium symporter family protein [Salmonella enterica]ECM5887094.1 bile acid:sodium symporter family protein [Salmonella enterica subsp. enterica serovar Infantis]ECM8203334.1 bile acid:sodium symporter family protein [Salmonella enterica subsp. enterica serovar Infantis]
MLAVITRLFPLWALLLSLIAYYTPSTFTPVGPWVATLLMLIMFGMGVHLNVDDFKRVLSRPAPVAAGIFLHYLVMPLAAWLLALLFKMPPDLSAGMVLVGSVASGTASNVMIYLAKGDVAGSASHIASVGFMVIIAVILHNTLGLLGGYWGGRLFGFDESTCRTLAIEVGMQNSGLAAALGKIYFGPLAALPGALFSVWHNLSGSLLAGYWSGKPIVEKSGETAKVN